MFSPKSAIYADAQFTMRSEGDINIYSKGDLAHCALNRIMDYADQRCPGLFLLDSGAGAFIAWLASGSCIHPIGFCLLKLQFNFKFQFSLPRQRLHWKLYPLIHLICHWVLCKTLIKLFFFLYTISKRCVLTCNFLNTVLTWQHSSIPQ